MIPENLKKVLFLFSEIAFISTSKGISFLISKINVIIDTFEITLLQIAFSECF